ncbi:hypothetical protein F5Y18DRAFT_430497 [Xylariaceae sp. FL1019]|nr:hypothetical protein F5Y18DRAFT_430497 [Xylariaceae sp. FL1019]
MAGWYFLGSFSNASTHWQQAHTASIQYSRQGQLYSKMVAFYSGCSDEDELPDIQIVVEEQKQKMISAQVESARDTTALQPRSPNAHIAPLRDIIRNPPATIKATPLRRRKFAPGHRLVEASLQKPWNAMDIHDGSDSRLISTSRQACSLQPSSAETSITSANEMLHQLPGKPQGPPLQNIPTRTMFDSPSPKKQRSQPFILTTGRKKTTTMAKGCDTCPSDCEQDSASNGTRIVGLLGKKDESSLFGKSLRLDLEDFSFESDGSSKHSRPESPGGGPRRLQRRVLSSSTGPGQARPAWMKPIGEGSRESPKKKLAAMLQASESFESACSIPASTEETEELDNIFANLKIFGEESSAKEFTMADGSASEPAIAPTTPKKTLVASPTKLPRIPTSPWKSEHKELWDHKKNAAWNDKHSPPKRSPKKPLEFGREYQQDLKLAYGTSPKKKQAKKAFDAVKVEIGREFLLELDNVITEGKLAQLTENTGGLRIEWSNTLLTTAGRAHWKCATTTTMSKQPSSSSSDTTTNTTKTQHSAYIELATKVLVNEADLLNTVAHEFCHLAVFLLHGKPKLAHGAEFKAFGRHVMDAATSKDDKKSLKIPRARDVQINVTTRHSYDIEYKFVWRCSDCSTEVSRHSRSVDPTKQRCGKCKGGQLVQVKPIPRGSASSRKAKAKPGAERDESMLKSKMDEGGKAEKAPKKKTAYQEFTAREMKALTITHKGTSFKEKMGLVSARWSAHRKRLEEKTTSAGDAATLVDAVEVLEIVDETVADEKMLD